MCGVRGQCPLKVKKFCHLEVKFAVFWHKKITMDLFLFLGGNFFNYYYFFCSKFSSRDIAEKDIACVHHVCYHN